MNEAKFQVGEYVQLVNLGSGNSPQYERTFAKVLTNRPATNPDNGYYYDVVVHDGRTKGLFERRLQKLPKGAEVQVTATISCTGTPVPPNTVGTIADVGDSLYGVRTTSKYYGVNCTGVQPVLTTQTSSTTQEETTMEAQVNTLTVGTKVRATQDVKGMSGTIRWLKGAVGQVTELGVRCTNDWFAVPEAQRQYWEVVSDDTPLTVCKPEPETLVGKRVKIRKSSQFYTEQGRTSAGKRRKGTVIRQHSDSSWVVVNFDDGYGNSYPIKDVKFLEDKPKVPKFVPEAVTKDTPVGTKVRVTGNASFTAIGAVGTLVQHCDDSIPLIQFDNKAWYKHFNNLETVHPDTAITKDNGDVAL